MKRRIPNKNKISKILKVKENERKESTKNGRGWNAETQAKPNDQNVPK
jgi:hypothetical protein